MSDGLFFIVASMRVLGCTGYEEHKLYVNRYLCVFLSSVFVCGTIWYVIYSMWVCVGELCRCVCPCVGLHSFIVITLFTNCLRVSA